MRSPHEYPPDLRQVVDDDRKWFRRNRKRRYRARFTTQAELKDFERRGVPITSQPNTIAVITLVENHGRKAGQTRMAMGASVVERDPTTLDDDLCQLLKEQMLEAMR
jgi:hypothetical protein